MKMRELLGCGFLLRVVVGRQPSVAPAGAFTPCRATGAPRRNGGRLAISFLLLSSALCACAQNYSINWYTISGASATSTGGVYSVTGTAGQPDVTSQTLTGGAYSVIGGFWSFLGTAQGPPVADFVLTLQPNSLTSNPGCAVQFVVSVVPLNGFSSQVTLAVGTLPTNVIAQFITSPKVTPPGNATLQIYLPQNVAEGTFPITFIGSAGDITNTISGIVDVTDQVQPAELAVVSLVPATNNVAAYLTSPFQSPTLQVSWAVANIGTLAAIGGWIDVIYVSTNAMLAGQISSTIVAAETAVAAGGSYTGTSAVTLPQVNGTYYLIYSANDNRGLYQTNFSNNQMLVGPITLTIQLETPDLAPVSLIPATNNVVFDTHSPQPTVSLISVVTNLGPGVAAGYWTDEIYVSTNTTVAGSVVGPDPYSSLQTAPTYMPLAADGSYTQTNTVYLPQQSGTYYLIYAANEDFLYFGTNALVFSEGIYESDTNNNILASVPVMVTYQVQPPDLEPVSLVPATNNVVYYPPAFYDQPAVQVSHVVTNLGPGLAVGWWYDEIFVSTNTTLGGQVASTFVSSYNYPGYQEIYEGAPVPGVFIGTLLSPVPAGGSYAGSTSVLLPPQSGTYYLIYVANYGGLGVIPSSWDGYYNLSGPIYEANTNNNLLVSDPVTVTYHVQLPDLAPVSLLPATNNFAFYSYAPGVAPTLPVTWAVTNLGPGLAGKEWDDVIYVSTNTTLSGQVSSNLMLEDEAVAVTGYYSGSSALALPAQAGNYYLIYSANDNRELPEVNYSNNLMVAGPVTVTYQLLPPPDLAPVSLVTLTNNVVFYAPQPGLFPTVQASWIVTNQGPGAAEGSWVDELSISTTPSLAGVVEESIGNALVPMTSPYLYSGPVPAGGSYGDGGMVSLPTQSGTYYLIYLANANWVLGTNFIFGNNALYEINTNNNLLVSGPITVTYQVRPPDLAPVSVVPATNHVVFNAVAPGILPTVQVSWAVTNQGTGTAPGGSWSDTIFVSITSSWTNWLENTPVNAIYPNSYLFPTVPAGSSYESTGLNWLPDGSTAVYLPPQSGTYYLIYYANPPSLLGPRLYESDYANNTSVGVPIIVTYQVRSPDLTPVSVAPATNNVVFYPPSPQSPTVQVSWAVTNQGPGVANSTYGWYDEIYVSTDRSLAGQVCSTFVGPEFGPVASDGSYRGTNTVTLPQQSGPYYLIYQANESDERGYGNGYGLYESNTNNNFLVSGPFSVTYQIQSPDLAPVSLVLATNNVAFFPPGIQSPTVQVSWTVTNLAPVPTTGFWFDVVYVSTNTTMAGLVTNAVGPTGAVFVNDGPGPVSANGSYRGAGTVTLPQQSGTYYLIYYANNSSGRWVGNLYEVNTNNNTLVSGPLNVTYQVQPPDLAPVSLVLATNNVVFYPPGPQSPSVQVTWAVTNQGIGVAWGEWFDSIYVSTGPTLAGQVGVATLLVQNGPVAPGVSYSGTNWVQLPRQSGAYYLIYSANDADGLYEANTSNNVLASSAPVTVTYQLIPPDLAPVSVVPMTNNVVFYPPNLQYPTVQVKWAVTNLGPGVAAGSWYDQIYVTDTGKYNWVEYTSVGPVVGPVAPGGSYSGTNTVTLPPQNGTYYLNYSANDDGGYANGFYIYESNTNNDTLIGGPVTVTFQVRSADLVPVSLVPSATNVAFYPPGSQPPTVQVTWTVTNLGPGVAVGSWDDAITVSTNTTLPPWLLTPYIVESGPVAAGGSYSGTNTVTLPSQSGTYYLIYGTGYTLYSSNELASVPITMTYQTQSPNLAPIGVAPTSNNLVFYSPSVPTVQVIWAVTNLGTAIAAGRWNDVIFVSTNTSLAGQVLPTPVGTKSGPVAVGGSYTGSTAVTLPQQSGSYYLIYSANDHRGLSEASYSNSLKVAGPVTLSMNPNFTLGTTARSEGPGAGSDSVVLGVNPPPPPWSASANASWLHLNAANQSGTGSTNVVFSYDANPGGTRTGTLNIAGHPFTITQAGSTYITAPGPVTDLAPYYSPTGLAVDGAGNVYFGDNFNIRLVFEWMATNNTVSWPVTGAYYPYGVALDNAGNLYIANWGEDNLLEWTAANKALTQLASLYGLNEPSDVAVDRATNVYIADTGDNAITKWTAAHGYVSTIVSSGLKAPAGVAVDVAGNVYIADTGNNADQRVDGGEQHRDHAGCSGLNMP